MGDNLDEIDLILNEIMKTSWNPPKKESSSSNYFIQNNGNLGPCWGRPMPREVQDEYGSLLN